MNIAATDYTLSLRSLDIYISGCRPPHCKGCHNPDLFNFKVGKVYDEKVFKSIKNKVSGFKTMINKIMIFGGEPLDQNYQELKSFLEDVRSLDKELWLFTKYEIDMVPTFVKEICDYVKTGKYDKEKTCEDNVQCGITLATTNQCIHDLRNAA